MVLKPTHSNFKFDFHRVELKEKSHHSDFFSNPHPHCVAKFLNFKMPECHLNEDLRDLFPVLEALEFCQKLSSFFPYNVPF